MIPLFFVDIETTGLKITDKITEIAFIITHDNKVHESAYINMVDNPDQGMLKLHLVSLINSMQCPIMRVVEYGAHFDSSRIRRLLSPALYGKYLHGSIDVLKLCRLKYPGISHTLENMARYLRIDVDSSRFHHADYDCEILLQVYRKINGIRIDS